MSEEGSGYGWLWFVAFVIAVCVLANAVKDDTHKSPTNNASTGVANAATVAQPDDASLAQAVGRGIERVALFDNTKRKVYFMLLTSWIPGETGSGVIRYQVEADSGDVTTPAADSQFLRRIQLRCRISAVITDNQDFKLRSIPLQFLAIEDDDHKITNLEANDSVPMTKAEYTSISTWSPSWQCY